MKRSNRPKKLIQPTMNSHQFQLIKKEIQKRVSTNNIISIVLFGSAVNTPQAAHDYDVLIVTKKLPPQDWMVAGEIKFRLLGKLDKPLDIVFIEEEDLTYSSPLIYEVSRKSRVLSGKNIIPKLMEASKSVRALTEGGVHLGWQIAE